MRDFSNLALATAITPTAAKNGKCDDFVPRVWKVAASGVLFERDRAFQNTNDGVDGGMWYYEGVGFTWFGRLEEVPDETGALEIDFSELPGSASANILKRLELPVRPGMTYAA